jgi:hypothetical protein
MDSTNETGFDTYQKKSCEWSDWTNWKKMNLRIYIPRKVT